MTSLKWLERIGFRLGLLLLMRGGWLWSALLLLEGAVSLGWKAYRSQSETDQRVLLEQLASFGNSLREGDAPVHALEMAEIRKYPVEFIPPSDEHFTLEIFEKQFRLFEKKLLLEEEMESDFAASRLRMGIMKYLPILSMLVLESFSGRKAPLLMRVGCAAGLLINYHIASYIEGSV